MVAKGEAEGGTLGQLWSSIPSPLTPINVDERTLPSEVERGGSDGGGGSAGGGAGGAGGGVDGGAKEQRPLSFVASGTKLVAARLVHPTMMHEEGESGTVACGL